VFVRKGGARCEFYDRFRLASCGSVIRVGGSDPDNTEPVWLLLYPAGKEGSGWLVGVGAQKMLVPEVLKAWRRGDE